MAFILLKIFAVLFFAPPPLPPSDVISLYLMTMLSSTSESQVFRWGDSACSSCRHIPQNTNDGTGSSRAQPPHPTPPIRNHHFLHSRLNTRYSRPTTSRSPRSLELHVSPPKSTCIQQHQRAVPLTHACGHNLRVLLTIGLHCIKHTLLYLITVVHIVCYLTVFQSKQSYLVISLQLASFAGSSFPH